MREFMRFAKMAILGIALLFIPTSEAKAMTIKIGNQTYYLTVFDNKKFSKFTNFFNETLLSHKRREKVTYCSSIIDLPVGTGNGNHSYGGYCSLEFEKKKSKNVLICADVMLGRLKVIDALQEYHEDGINVLSRFVVENCYGG